MRIWQIRPELKDQVSTTGLLALGALKRQLEQSKSHAGSDIETHNQPPIRSIYLGNNIDKGPMLAEIIRRNASRVCTLYVMPCSEEAGAPDFRYLCQVGAKNLPLAVEQILKEHPQAECKYYMLSLLLVGENGYDLEVITASVRFCRFPMLAERGVLEPGSEKFESLMKSAEGFAALLSAITYAPDSRVMMFRSSNYWNQPTRIAEALNSFALYDHSLWLRDRSPARKLTFDY